MSISWSSFFVTTGWLKSAQAFCYNKRKLKIDRGDRMTFESQYFKRKSPNPQKLLDFGFKKDETNYRYSQTIMAGNFEAQILVSQQGQVSGRLMDTDLDEEYTAIHVGSQIGSYLGQVRETYGDLLQEIAANCFEDTPFDQAQTNRLVQHLKEKFADDFDHPFAKYPQYASFRHPANNKWYALVFPLKLDKLDSQAKPLTESDLQRETEVINIKIDKKDLDDLLKKPGIYPSYHMNKQSWISLLMDDSLPDKEVFDLVETSRDLVGPKSFRAESGPDYWLIPANPKYYDIDAEFATTDTVYWTQKAQIKKGDWVCIYMTSPIQAVRYACQVLESQIPNEVYQDRPDVKEIMTLKRVKTFADQDFPLATLKEAGVKAVRGPRHMTKALIDKIKKAL